MMFCWTYWPPGLVTILPGGMGCPETRCCGEVIRGAGEVSLPGIDGEGDGPGLNGLSSAACECGVPIRGDCCIVLYGDMALFELVWFPPGLCITELTDAGPGLCDMSGPGECSGLWLGCSIGLFSGDCAIGWWIMFCCELGEGDINGDGGAIWAGELPGPLAAAILACCFVLYSPTRTVC